jgi:hypothetical protein
MFKCEFISRRTPRLLLKLMTMKRPFCNTMDLGNITKIYCKIIKPDIALESNLYYQIFLPELLNKKRMKVHMNAWHGFYSGQDNVVAS